MVERRKTLLRPLDDVLAVVREFIHPEVSRSGLDRCLRRHGVGNLRALRAQAPRPAHQPCRDSEPGFVHLDVKDLPQMPDEKKRRSLFVAIDRATRWVFVQIKRARTATAARAFLAALARACPIRIRKRLTDNGKEFTDRLCGSRQRGPRVRSALGSLGDRTPVDSPQASSNQRYGGTVQRAHRSSVAHSPLHKRRASGADHRA